MDIVSKLPFTLKIKDCLCEEFTFEERLIYGENFQSIKIYENEEIYILFNSEDSSARLYLDALDILPDGNNVLIDDDGLLYRPVSNFPFPLYKHGNEYDALRVDAFKICVVCNSKKYYSLLEVLPKQLSMSEWTMMRNDLEDEIQGLAQDIVRRNIGLGNSQAGIIPPEKLYTFFVVQKYAPKVLASLIALQNSPKYHIATQYIEEDCSKAVKMDAITVRKYLHSGGATSVYSIPVKQVDYDIQENRLLKRIITIYDRELLHFSKMIEEIIEKRRNSKKKEHKQYQLLYDQSLCDFLNTSNKLRQVTTIIKTQNWYQTVGPLKDGIVPHTFALDYRYGVLYKLYEDLRNPNFKIQLDPNYSYSWKKSSSLYEMWCYIKICRAFACKYNIVGNTWDLTFGDDSLFPYLSNGVKMAFENDLVQIEVIFDQFVPTKASSTQLHNHPFYTVGKHKRPDITIDIYTKKDDWYIGSIILECKYRKLSSFWQGSSEWSSKPQIQAYYTENKSDLTYNEYGGHLDIRPIQSVIVLTPDIEGDGKSAVSINTLIRTLKPDTTNRTLENIIDSIENGIENRYQQYRKLKKLSDIEKGSTSVYDLNNSNI